MVPDRYRIPQLMLTDALRLNWNKTPILFVVPPAIEKLNKADMTVITNTGKTVYMYDSKWFSNVIHETTTWEQITYAIRLRLWVSNAWKNMTLQKVWRNTKHMVNKAEYKQKYSLPPFNPIVPGPLMAARIFTSEKAPLIRPKPKPETYESKWVLVVIAEFESVTWRSPCSDLRRILYTKYLNTSWKQMEVSTPNQIQSFFGKTNHRIDEKSREQSQKNELAIRIMMRIGSFIMVQ